MSGTELHSENQGDKGPPYYSTQTGEWNKELILELITATKNLTALDIPELDRHITHVFSVLESLARDIKPPVEELKNLLANFIEMVHFHIEKNLDFSKFYTNSRQAYFEQKIQALNEQINFMILEEYLGINPAPEQAKPLFLEAILGFSLPQPSRELPFSYQELIELSQSHHQFHFELYATAKDGSLIINPYKIIEKIEQLEKSGEPTGFADQIKRELMIHTLKNEIDGLPKQDFLTDSGTLNILTLRCYAAYDSLMRSRIGQNISLEESVKSPFLTQTKALEHDQTMRQIVHDMGCIKEMSPLAKDILNKILGHTQVHKPCDKNPFRMARTCLSLATQAGLQGPTSENHTGAQ